MPRVAFSYEEGIHRVYALSYAGPGSACRLLDVVLSRLLAENETDRLGATVPRGEREECMKQEPPVFRRGLCGTRLQGLPVGGISSHGRATYHLRE